MNPIMRNYLDEAWDKGVRKAGGTLKSEKEIEMDGRPGRELVVELAESRVPGGGILRSRIYLVGRTQYQAVAMSPKAKVRSGEMEAFLESFRLKGEKAKKNN
jgi:hypothetical protein